MKTTFLKTKLVIVSILLSMSNLVWAQDNFRTDLPSSQFVAQGWVSEFLHRQETGLTGHPEQSGWPFNTQMWTEEMDVADDEFQYWRSPWWPYEHTGYYLDGALRAAYAINSKPLMDKVDANIQYLLDHADADGRLHAGNIGTEHEWWPMVVIMRMLFEKYDASKNPDLLRSIEKHYKAIYSSKENYTIPKTSGFYIRSVLHVEHLCALYRITKDKFYLESAEKLYTGFQDQAEKMGTESTIYQFSAKGMAQEIKSTGHGVTYHEFLKLPAILYKYTGNEAYKKAVYGALRQLERNHELADGLSSCSEPFAGKGPEKVHEMCNVVDFNWSLGYALLATGDPYFADKMEKCIYNAGFSSVTSDFKAHQYFSCPNLVMSTGMSSRVDDDMDWGFGSKGRKSYKPGHDTQCCSGNIHRMFPSFISRTCMIDKRKVSLVFYMPCTINIPVDNQLFSFTQETNYPFEHDVRIKINSAPSSKVEFSMRIPQWADAYQILVNDKVEASGSENTIFKTINRKFKRGDVICLKLNTHPKIDDRGQGVAINYGPLVFAQPIEAKTREISSDYAKKCSADFPAYEFYPKYLHDWAVALSKNIKPEDISIIATGASGYPWDYGNSPITLSVKAKPVNNWKLINWLSLAPFPDTVEVDTSDLTLKLEPMGATLLRLTEFPKGDF